MSKVALELTVSYFVAWCHCFLMWFPGYFGVEILEFGILRLEQRCQILRLGPVADVKPLAEGPVLPIGITVIMTDNSPLNWNSVKEQN